MTLDCWTKWMVLKGTCMSEFRVEKDTMGEVQVPAQAYYGAQTQRAVENFPISGQPLPKSLIRALGLVKAAAAIANRDLGKLKPEFAEPIIRAAREVAEGRFDNEFPIDVYQTGSGTSSNMNANEVIGSRAIELTGGDRISPKKSIHANDHVNMGQSTNDMFPTAIHVAAAQSIHESLLPSLQRLRDVLSQKSQEWDRIIKIGRTHLADATPIRLGQEFSGYARQAELAIDRGRRALEAVLELPAIAVGLFSIANNIRWLGSGPRCGFYEVMLPDRQPGSSIMPGKVNPVMCESMMQVCARVMGNDQTIAFSGATGGQFQLNIMMPVMGHATLESIELLASATEAFVDLCAIDME